MENIIENGFCIGCMACTNICPNKAIKIIKKRDGFDYPQIDKKTCINCGLCKKVCPINNEFNKNINDPEVYACKNKNEKIRMQSSSGGMFTLIAKWILENHGVVFGVKLDENMEAVHSYVETEEDLSLFRGAKYLQSKIGNSYQKIKEFLNQNRKVLFTGTPCQVEGLLSYLGKDYNNLYTQDFICHGVPSPEVWQKYLKYKKKLTGDNPLKINFRNKNILGWSNYHVHYQYSNSEENVHHKEEPYMNLFLKNLILRESCYNCQFKKIKRNSDITIADFWGINKVKPDFNDEKGVSAILVHSKKGKEVFEAIKNYIEFSIADIEDIMKYNSCIYKSAPYNSKREAFFEDLGNENFETLIKKYL